MAQLFAKPLPPPPSPEAGRRVAAQIALLLIGAEVLVILVYTTGGTGRLDVQVGRLVITCLLCFALYRGFRWAWWVMVVLVVLGTLAAGFTTLGLLRSDSPVSVALMGSLFAAYLVAVYRLIWSQELRDYIDEH